MTARSLGTVAIAILGLCHLLESLTSASVIFPAIMNPDLETVGSLRGWFIPFTVSAFAGAVLLVLRKQLATILFPCEEPTEFDYRELRAVLFCFAGLLLAGFAAVNLLSAEIGHHFAEQTARDELEMPLFQLRAPESLRVARIRLGAQLALGVTLIIGGRGLSGAIESLREAGRRS